MPAERQVGAVDLYDDPRVDDRVVFALHDVGQGVEILLVARVVPVLEEAPDLAGRRRGHEDLVRAGGRGGVLEILDVALHGGPVLPRDWPRARRTLLEWRRELPGHLGPLGELLGV